MTHNPMNNQVILLVEDNSDDAVLAVRAFKKHNLVNDIVVVCDGVEALEYLHCEGEYKDRDCNEQPKIVILDLNLPRLNGLEVLKDIRNDDRTKLLPVIMLTSSVEESDVLNCYGSGANSYIHKPIDYDKFSDMSQQLVDYWFTANTPPPLNGQI
ncbi:MAG: response regulator [Thiohalomonadales bacterium]